MREIEYREWLMLRDVIKFNDHKDGFRSYVINSGGSKASNFMKIALQKRAGNLVAKGMLKETPYGYEITDMGRRAID